MAPRKAEAKKKTLKKEPAPVGRPTKYELSMCDVVIAEGRRGAGVAEMAVACDVCIDTIYEWVKVHPEFSEALTRAQTEAEAWWATHTRKGLSLPPSEFQGAANLKYMGIRFQDRWSDKSRVELSGPNGGPIQTDEVSARDIIAGRISGLAARRSAVKGTDKPDGNAGE